MSELADFVLDAFRQAGGIVEPPAYGIYEALLPERVARRWNVPPYQRLAFANEPTAETIGEEQDVVIIGYGHPLLETLLDEVRAQPAAALVYVNEVRLDKQGLLDLARQALTFSNGRLWEVPAKVEAAALCHNVRFNFKAALITDEKRERLVSVVLDAQAGFAVPELAHIEQLVWLSEEPAFEHLAAAPVRWLPGHQALSRPVLEGLLERARHAAADELAAPLEVLQRGAARHLELDQARLTEYYDGIARDLQRRVERASDHARRAAQEAKLAATQAERAAKLADVEAKYRLRVELELINLQVIAQPKALLPVRIENRTARVERTVVWDPLLRRIEPLACDVCGRPATRLVLCGGGHLVHEECLLERQCVDCKRVYCRLCADQMARCVVCHRPVCAQSLNRCRECERGTCREHVGLCHAADGQPAQLQPPELARPASPVPPTEKVEETPAPTLAPQPRRERRRKAAPRAAQRPSRAVKKPSLSPAPFKIEVYIDPEVPEVDAFVLMKGKKQMAVRSWELTDEGIAVVCQCEKWYRCPAQGMLLKPVDGAGIEAQIEAQIEELRQEYGISSRRVFRYAVVHGARRQVPRVVLRGEWKRERDGAK